MELLLVTDEGEAKSQLFVSISQFALSQLNQYSRITSLLLPCLTLSTMSLEGDNRNWSRPIFLCWKAGLNNVLERENLELFGFFLKYSVYHIRKMLTNNCSQKVGTGGPGFISGQITWIIVLRRKSGSCSLFLFAGFLTWNGNFFWVFF